MRSAILYAAAAIAGHAHLTAGLSQPAQERQHIFRKGDNSSAWNGTTGSTNSSRPNIVFILTDDQDVHLDSLSYMPFVRKHLTEQGTTFTRHYCTTALCCPSRVTLWTGQLAHNTNVTDVHVPWGGYPKFVSQGYNSDWFPVWLEEAGINSYYTGKLFNAHSVTTYNDPFPAGFKHTYFLLDPHTYDYLNATFQHDKEAPVSYAGNYSTDTLAGFGHELLDNAVADGAPFFLTLAPIAPHSNVNPYVNGGAFSAPIPADRHKDLFPDAIVPRTANFNPETPSGANWVAALERQNQTVLDYNDYFYRQRLRSLQALDELVDGVFARLEAYGLLDNTYVVYSADNGFHIGQHRLQPGKTCGYEEDINVPLIIRGPGVEKNVTVDGVVTSHTDLAPTFLQLLGLPLRDTFDGTPIPVTKAQRECRAAEEDAGSGEHVNVEFWGHPYIEGNYGLDADSVYNTYKALRVIGDDYSLYYSVWCNNEHELYDMRVDPGQLHNLVGFNGTSLSRNTTILSRPVTAVSARLDALLLVLKSCRGATCVRPWAALHPDGSVRSLKDALDVEYDAFYEKEQVRVGFDACELGYFPEKEGPQWNTSGKVFAAGQGKVYERDGLPWDVWT